MAALNLRLLGGFEARLGKKAVRLPKKAQALLACLVLAPGSSVSRATLATRLWGDDGEDDARNNLRQVLFRIRRSLGSASRLVMLRGDMVGLDPALIGSDVSTFQRLAAGSAEAALQEAADLYRGDLLEGLEVGEAYFEEWLRGERERLHELGIKVLSRLLTRQVDGGRAESAIRTALRLLALDPLQESGHRALMRAYATDGRRPAALRQYQLCVDALQRELQAEPEDETRRLYIDILRQPPRDDVPAPGAPRGPRVLVPTPLIGRAAEMARLRQELADARGGSGRVTVVLGEAGVGKTRLAQELGAEAAGSGWLVLEARGHETEQNLPFALWVEAFRSAGFLDDPALIGALEPAWRHALAPLFPETTAERVHQRWRVTEDRLRLYEALCQLVRVLAAGRPLLLVLEDLHWSDATSLRLLAFLGRRLKGLRICVLGTARVEDGDVASMEVLASVLAELRSERRLTDVSLPPLSRHFTLELIGALTPSRHRREPDLVERIWGMSEGNPFVAIEALRAVGGRSRTGTVADLALPESVRRLILARLERLSAGARDMVGAAAVVGRDFEYDLLLRASGLKDHEAAGALEELVRRRVLRQNRRGFDFAHDRIREAVLGALLPPRRRLLHAEVARALEALHAGHLDEHFASLAFHCREAELWTEAVDHLRQASMVAASRGAFRDSAALLEEALRALDNLPPGRPKTERAIDIRIELGDRSMVLADFPRVEEALLEAIALATGPEDELRAAFARVIITHHDLHLRKLDRGLRLADEALATAERLGDPVVETRAAFNVGAIRAVRGEHPAAIGAFEHAIRAAGDDPLTMVTIGLGICHPTGRAWKAVSLAQLGHFDEAVTLAEEAVARADAARNIMSMAWTRLMLGRIHLLRGDLEPAMEALEPAHQYIDRYELVLIRRACVIYLAQAHLLKGFPEAALDSVRQGPRVWPSSFLVESEALLAAGRTDEALGVVVDALTLARGGSERGQEAWGLLRLGEIQTRSDAVELARDAFSQALAIAVALGLRPYEALAHQALGQLLSRLGEADAAREHLATALRLYQDMGMSRWVEPTRAAIDAVASLAAPALRQ
ncbi:MAG: ATP-binding protein [Candidatus Rokuibacteriota bacterium]